MNLSNRLRYGTSAKALGFVMPALFLGCTNLLGIDGAYVQGELDSTSSGGAVGAGGRDSGGAVETGGITGSGGVPSPGSGGSPEREAGVTGHDSGTHCRAGHHEGVFDGSHRPLVTFVGVPVTVSAGTMTLDLAGKGDVLSVTGELHAKLTSVVPDAGNFTATLAGHFDCRTGEIRDGKLTGTLSIVSIPAAFEGEWEGEVSPDGAFTGTWTEAETNRAPTEPDAGAPRPCVPTAPGTGQPIGKGCGTWRVD